MKNELIFDNAGVPSIMVTVPKFKLSEVISGAPDIVHPAFVVNGKEIDEISISKYQNIVIGGKAYSLPLQQPTGSIDFDGAVSACEAKGAGWHLMTNAEWAAIALWAKKNGTLPHGNTSSGKYHADRSEHGILFDNVRTLTGSGPKTWAHDHTELGIYDLNGNVWEWVGGIRWVDGEPQIIPDNNAAYGADQSEGSKEWRPVMTGSDSVKYRVTDDEITLTTEQPDQNWDGSEFNDLQSEIEVPDILKALALYPADDEPVDGYFWLDTEGERLAFRGGTWANGTTAGVFALYGYAPRSLVDTSIGFRSAYVRPSAICPSDNPKNLKSKSGAPEEAARIIGERVSDSHDGTMIEGAKVWGPRGYYYEWALVCEDCIVFGDEQGNYAGGVTISPERTKDYEGVAARKLSTLKSSDAAFYELIHSLASASLEPLFKYAEAADPHR